MNLRLRVFLLTFFLSACGTKSDNEPHSQRSLSDPFRDISADVGLQFEHFTGATGEYYFPEMVGAGAALLDYDTDGDLDLYLIQSDFVDPNASVEQALFPPQAGVAIQNVLFRNEFIPTGSLAFTEVTEVAGVDYRGVGMGVAVGDIDNDGYPDLYLTNFGDNVLYRNQGDGTFKDITSESGVNDPRFSTSASFLDIDGDGNLDLFVSNYVHFTRSLNKDCSWRSGRRDYCGPKAFDAVSDRVFLNQGDRTFKNVSARSGVRQSTGSGLGVVAADFNNDGRQDIYVANDQRPNHLWMNQGDGTFEDRGLMAGAAYNATGKAESSMGVTAGDFDGDGDEDLFMTHLATETNTLYLNDGTGRFDDTTVQFNLAGDSIPYTGFGSEWFDYDNNGTLDLFVANGAVAEETSQIGKDPYPYGQKNQLFRNDDNRRFVDVSLFSGSVMQLSEVSRGAAFGDIDNDGDTDIVVTNNNGPVRLLLNEVGNKKNWLRVRLVGKKSNRDGIGARVGLVRGEEILWRRAHRDGSYLSANDVRVHFGLGDSEDVDGIVVKWLNGHNEIFRDYSEANTEITLTEFEGTPWVP